MLDLLPRNTMLRIYKVLMFQTVKPIGVSVGQTDGSLRLSRSICE
ncbi:MAG: hypothetical protein RL240_469 [Planctomycetota bacterium]|jgi:hypothetical protein